MARKPPLTKASIKEALTKTHGYKEQAARLLGRTRQTISNYCKKHKDIDDFIEELRQVRGDQYENTLHKMALGDVVHVKEETENEIEQAEDGTETVITKITNITYYRQAPHFPALKLALEIVDRYKESKVHEFKDSFQLDIAGKGVTSYPDSDENLAEDNIDESAASVEKKVGKKKSKNPDSDDNR